MNNQKIESRRSLYKAAYIINYVITIISGLALIPLAWMIPITRKTKQALNDVGTLNDKNNTTLAIISFFFSFEVAGIMILLADFMYPAEVKIAI